MDKLIGKTIQVVEYEGGDFHLHFTDGTCLSVFGGDEAGEIQVIYEGDVIEPTEN